MATVSTSVNLTAVPYVAGEDITVNSGAILTIDATPSPNPGSLICITAGEVHITNASPTTPIVVTLSDLAKDYRFEKNGILRCTGAMIELTPGTGALQTWDFSIAPLNTIPFPSYVEIEEAAGSGTYMPRLVFVTAGKTVTVSSALWGSGGMHADVLFWNASTRVLSSGNGTNGNVIPTGCKVRIPNIYLHSATTTATQLSRTLIDLSPTGRLIASCVSFSDHLAYSNSGAGLVSLTRCGFTGLFSHINTNYALTLDHVANNKDTEIATGNGLSVASVLGAADVHRVATTHHVANLPAAGVVFNLNLIPNCTRLEKVFALGTARNNVGASAMEIVQVAVAGGQAIDLVGVGAAIEVTDCSDLRFVRLRHGDGIGTVQSVANAQVAVLVTTSARLAFVDIGKVGVMASRTGLIQSDARSLNIKVYGGSYDFSNNGATSVFQLIGFGAEVYNFTALNLRTASRFAENTATFSGLDVRYYNCRASLIGTLTNEPVQGGVYDGIPSSSAAIADWITTFTGGADWSAAHLLAGGTAPTAGWLVFGPYTAGAHAVYTGTAAPDQAGVLELPGLGDSAEIESPVLHGITAFANVAPRFTYRQSGANSANTATPPATMTLEFAAANPGGAYSAYTALTAGDLSAALAALPGYNATNGVRVKLRVTATSADSTRTLTLTYWETVFTPAYTAAESTVTLLGPAPTDETTMYRVSDDSVVAVFVGPGVQSFPGAADEGDLIYFVRRTSGGVELMRTQADPQVVQIGDNGEVSLYYGAEVQTAGVSTLEALIAAVAGDVWDRARSGHVTAGSFGAVTEWAGGGGGGLDAAGVRAAIGLASANLDTQLAALPTDLDVQNAAENALAAFDFPTLVADSVWEADRADYVTSGTYGAVSEWGGGGSGLDAAGVRAAIGLSTANLDTQLAAIKTDTAAILVDTDVTLPAAIGDIPTDGEMTALLDGLADVLGDQLISAPEVAIAVWEAVRGDYGTAGTFGELSAWTGIPLTAAGTRSALGMTAANLDTQLGALASGVVDVLEDTGTTLPTQIAALPAPLTAAGTRSAVGLASADLDTQLSGLSTAISNRPTYAQVETLLEASAENMGYAVWDHLLTESVAPGTFGAEVAKSTELQPASAAALNAYDPPTHAELTSATAAVPAAVRTELATELNRIDAAVSTRLASGSYVVPLDASATRSAIGLASANLDTQLGLLTAGLAAVFEDTGTTLPSQIAALPTPLTASGVRGAIGLASANLDTQLLQLDTAIGTRLASSSYVIPLDAAATRAAVGLSSANLDAQISDIPDAVRAELTVELDRIDVAISTRAEPGSGMTAADIRSAIGISDPNLEAMLGIINTGVQLSSLIVPHTEDLP